MLYALTDRALAGGKSHAEIVRLLCAGGVRLVQVREKTLPDRDLLAAARPAVAVARAAGALVIVNDRADVAALCGADGVHLGGDDLPCGEARAILGPAALIGRSTHSVEEALASGRHPASYVALGPIFDTPHASARRPALGIAAVSTAARALPLPLVAIGGITLDNAAEVLAAGAASVAVMGDLMTAPDIAARAAEFVSLLSR